MMKKSICILLTVMMMLGTVQGITETMENLPAVLQQENVLREGDRGEAVTALQLRLAELHYTQTETDGCMAREPPRPSSSFR